MVLKVQIQVLSCSTGCFSEPNLSAKSSKPWVGSKQKLTVKPFNPVHQFETYPDTFATDSQKIVFLLSKEMSSACILVTPKPLQNRCLWIAQHWCTCILKCSSYSQDWAGVLAGAYSSSSDLGGYLAVRSGQHRSTKNRLHGKILVSYICPNLCQTPQTGNGSADLGASFQSTEFIYPMTCTVSLQIWWDCGQLLCYGTKGWKSFPSL